MKKKRKTKYKIKSVEREGTANDGLYAVIEYGKETWDGYLEKTVPFSEGLLEELND